MTSRPPSRWQRLRRKLRDEGPRHTALLILNGLVPRPLIDVRVWVVASTDLSDFIDAEIPDVGVHWNHGADGDDAAVEERLAQGKLAAVIERGDRVVAWEIFAAGDFVKENWLRFTFRDKDVYGIAMFVKPEYRGQGLAVGLASFAYRELARLGYLRDYGVTDALNLSSLRTSAKARHWPVGRIVYVRCGGFTVIGIDGRFRAGFWSARNPLVIDFSAFDDKVMQGGETGVSASTVHLE